MQTQIKILIGSLIASGFLFLAPFANAATLGNLNGITGQCGNSGNYVYGSPFNMPSSTGGTVSQMGILIYNGVGENYKMAIYDSVLGGDGYQHPNNLLAQTATGTTIVSGAVDATNTLPLSVHLNASTTYWLMWNHEEPGGAQSLCEGSDYATYPAPNENSDYKNVIYTGGTVFPSTYGTRDGATNFALKIWADYTPDGGGATSCDNTFPIENISPGNGSTTLVDFSAFNVSSTLDENGGTCSYGIKIYWWKNSAPGTVRTANAYYHIYPDTPNGNFSINKYFNLWTIYNGTSTTFTWFSTVYDTTNGIGLGVSATTTFTLRAGDGSNIPPGYNPDTPCGGQCYNFNNGNQSIYTATTTSNILDASSSAFCNATSTCSWLDTGCYSSRIAAWLFCLQPFATDAIQGAVNGLQTMPVTAAFTNMNGVIQGLVGPDGSMIIYASGTEPYSSEQSVILPFFSTSTAINILGQQNLQYAILSSSTIRFGKNIQDLFLYASPFAFIFVLFFL